MRNGECGVRNRKYAIRHNPLPSGSSINRQRARERAVCYLFRIDPTGGFFAPRVGGVGAGQVAGMGGGENVRDSVAGIVGLGENSSIEFDGA